jgi:pyruvate dehydrogenase E2 component (dihydrolipoamide acetyltransferase)
LDLLRSDVQKRTIPAKELQGSTITLSNFGTMTGRYANPIIVPPQVAILGAGVIRKEACVIENNIAIQQILPLSLSFDHRALTGGEASRFLMAIIKDLEKENT